jgi:hypothetical protein
LGRTLDLFKKVVVFLEIDLYSKFLSPKITWNYTNYMNIYVGHSSSINFEDRLYRPLEKSKISDRYNLVFPHKDDKQIFDSKRFLREECDLFVAEVSEASTGLGIELGWADMLEVPVLAVHREKSEYSNSIKAVADEIEAYSGTDELINIIENKLKEGDN